MHCVLLTRWYCLSFIRCSKGGSSRLTPQDQADVQNNTLTLKIASSNCITQFAALNCNTWREYEREYERERDSANAGTIVTMGSRRWSYALVVWRRHFHQWNVNHTTRTSAIGAGLLLTTKHNNQLFVGWNSFLTSPQFNWLTNKQTWRTYNRPQSWGRVSRPWCAWPTKREDFNSIKSCSIVALHLRWTLGILAAFFRSILPQRVAQIVQIRMRNASN